MRQTFILGLGTREHRLCFDAPSAGPTINPPAAPPTAPPVQPQLPPVFDPHQGFEALKRDVEQATSKDEVLNVKETFQKRLDELSASIDPAQIEELKKLLEARLEVEAIKTVRESKEAVEAMLAITVQTLTTRRQIFGVLSRQGSANDVVRGETDTGGFEIFGINIPGWNDMPGVKHIYRWYHEIVVAANAKNRDGSYSLPWLPDWLRPLLGNVEGSQECLARYGARDGIEEAVTAYLKTRAGVKVRVVFSEGVWLAWADNLRSQGLKVDAYAPVKSLVHRHILNRLPTIVEEEVRKGNSDITIGLARIPSPDRRVQAPTAGPGATPEAGRQSVELQRKVLGNDRWRAAKVKAVTFAEGGVSARKEGEEWTITIPPSAVKSDTGEPSGDKATLLHTALTAFQADRVKEVVVENAEMPFELHDVGSAVKAQIPVGTSVDLTLAKKLVGRVLGADRVSILRRLSDDTMPTDAPRVRFLVDNGKGVLLMNKHADALTNLDQHWDQVRTSDAVERDEWKFEAGTWQKQPRTP